MDFGDSMDVAAMYTDDDNCVLNGYVAAYMMVDADILQVERTFLTIFSLIYLVFSRCSPSSLLSWTQTPTRIKSLTRNRSARVMIYRRKAVVRKCIF
jgi:hypothetical protein